MWAVCKKEFRQFFSSLTGYIAIIVFLLLTSLLLFVFPDTSILDFGYASLDKFFDLAPWILLLVNSGYQYAFIFRGIPERDF